LTNTRWSMEVEITAGFLVVKTFERMCREYLANFKEWQRIKYPNANPVLPEQMPGKYRGIARDPIQPWIEGLRDSGVVEPTEQEFAASIFMGELTKAGKEHDDFILALDDARKLLEMIQPPVEREIIWARRMDRTDPPPAETIVLGYEPTVFYPCEHDSVIADKAFFRYRRGADKYDQKRMRFREHHAKLNRWGLFDTPTDSQKYLVSLLKLNPNERTEGTLYIAEIRALTE
jgi:hypothetical protein